MEAIFPDGKPLKVNKADFKRQYLASFPKFVDSTNDAIIDDAIEAVYDMFSGVNTIWDLQEPQVWFDKTRRCYLYLTAWYIADMYPRFAVGIPSMGGIPIKEKRIGGIDLKFDNDMMSNGQQVNLLRGLLSNPFGKMAYTMITCSAKRTALK